jgi:hypothetical protein
VVTNSPLLTLTHFRTALVWVGLLILALTHCQGAFPQDAEPQSSRILRGTVINSATREPVPHALVYASDNRFATFTDDLGRFEFKFPCPTSESSAPAPGPQISVAVSNSPSNLIARKPGFFEDGASTYTQSPGQSGDITIALTPESLIVGRVNLPASNQFDRITVDLYKRQVSEGRAHWVSVDSTSARSGGEFRFAGLQPGTYKLFTEELLDRDPLTFTPLGQLYGYPPIYYPTAADFTSAAPIILEAGKTFQTELSPVLQPYYPVKIALTNAHDADPLQISVSLQGHRGPGYSLGRDADGSIAGMLPNGTYTVQATRFGPSTSTGITTITIKGAPLAGASMTLIPDALIPVNVREEMSAKASASVSRFYQGGISRPFKVRISLQSADALNFVEAGQFRPPLQPGDTSLAVQNVRPGRYWITITPYRGYVASATSNGVDLLRQPLVVGTGSASPIDITLRDDTGSIEGGVDGMPASTPTALAGAAGYFSRPAALPQVALYCIPLPDSPGRFARAAVQPDGSFRFQDVAPGAYRVLAFDREQPELEFQNPEAMRAYEDKGPVVRVAPDDTERVRVPLIRTSE